MRQIILHAGCCLFSLLLAPAVHAQQPATANTPDSPPAAGMLSGRRADLAPQGSPANRWRYSFHDGHWWYYRDGGRWSYWAGREWLDYEPNSYHRWYVRQKMAEVDASLARFDARLMRYYMSPTFGDGYSGMATYNYRGPMTNPPLTSARPATSLWARPGWTGVNAAGSAIFTPRAFDGRLNPATSIGGYMGAALRGPFGY